MFWSEDVHDRDLHYEVLHLVGRAESLLGFELEITSGYREGDARCHGRGRAIDIACRDSQRRFKIVQALTAVGFRRIGIYNKHVHADTCVDLMPQDVMWLGISR